jgi:hypothetical protein
MKRSLLLNRLHGYKYKKPTGHENLQSNCLFAGGCRHYSGAPFRGGALNGHKGHLFESTKVVLGFSLKKPQIPIGTNNCNHFIIKLNLNI